LLFLVGIHHSTISPLTCDYLSANRQRRTESAPRAARAVVAAEGLGQAVDLVRGRHDRAGELPRRRNALYWLVRVQPVNHNLRLDAARCRSFHIVGRELARRYAAWQMLACCINAAEHDG
jgi:hypothetical protein